MLVGGGPDASKICQKVGKMIYSFFPYSLHFIVNLEMAYLQRNYDCLWQLIVKLQLKLGSCFATENTSL